MVRGGPSGIQHPGKRAIRGRIIQRRGEREREIAEMVRRAGPRRLRCAPRLNTLVVQITAEAPAFFEKRVTKVFDVPHDTRPFARADVQPDARAGFDAEGARKAMNELLIPPNRRRECGDFSKNGGMLEPNIE